MTLVTYTLNIGNEKSLDSFDSVTSMAFGDNPSSPTENQTQLNNELLRVTLSEKTKNVSNNTYEFTGRIPLTQLNAIDIYEVGLFDSSNNLYGILVLDIAIQKTQDDELYFRLIVKTNTINV